MDCKDLFGYFKRERDGLVQTLGNLPSEEFTKNRGLSFESIKDVLAHTVMVEDIWLHYRAAGKPGGVSRRLEEFKDLQDIKEYMGEVDAKTAALLDRTAEADLRREVKFTRGDGKEESYTLEEILCHVPVEVIHHYGEIFAELWKMGISAPYYSYLAYSKAKTA